MGTDSPVRARQRILVWLRRPRAVGLLLVIALVTFTLGERTYLAAQRNIMEAGDSFNFLSLAQAYSQGRLVKGEKRLPLYPLTILVAWKGLGLDPLVAATSISVLAGGATTALLYILGRRMKIRPLPLAVFLLLWTLEPVTNSVGIRPLADSLFLFLVVAATLAATIVGSSLWAALRAGGMIALLMLARFESMVLAPVLAVMLRLRLPWRRVFLAALPMLLLYAAWIPYSLYIHGTITGGYFTEWSDKEGAVGGRPGDVPKKLQRIAAGVGWSRPWTQADWVLEQSEGNPLPRLLSSASWWVGMLALIGVPWLLLTARRAAVPFLAIFLVFTGLYSMWVIYGRFVAPGVPAFYVSAAAGASALFSIAFSLFRPRVLRAVAVGAITIFLLWIVREEAPGLMRATALRVFDNEGSGYSMVLAIRELTQREGRVALNHDLMAIIYLGIIGEPLAPPQRAIMLGEAAEVERGKTLADQTAEHIERLRKLDIRYLVERGEPRILRILDVLKKRGAVVRTEEIRYPKGQPPGLEFDITRIHTLSWSGASTNGR